MAIWNRTVTVKVGHIITGAVMIGAAATGVYFWRKRRAKMVAEIKVERETKVTEEPGKPPKVEEEVKTKVKEKTKTEAA